MHVLMSLADLDHGLNWGGKDRLVLEVDWGPSGITDAPGQHKASIGRMSKDDLMRRVREKAAQIWGKADENMVNFLVESCFFVSGAGKINVNAFTKNRAAVTVFPYTDANLNEEFNKWM